MGSGSTQSNWSGFLPSRAIVMGRARQISHATTASSPIEEATAHVTPPASQTLVPAPAPATITENNRASMLAQVTADLVNCQRCKLCEKRNTIVVGEGNPEAELVFVGEGPGEHEDLEGRPFIGRAGELLDKMIEAMGLHRNQVYICNVVKCRPPGNRNPEPDEIAACGPFLERQLQILRPKVVVALGKFAAQTLLQTEAPISKLRGQFHTYRPKDAGELKLMPTFHPAYLLRSPESKREAWSDLQQVARELGLQIPSKKG